MVDGSRRKAAGDRLAHGDVHLLRVSCASLTLPNRGISWYLMRLRYRRMVVGRMLVCPSIQVPRKSPTVCRSEDGATPESEPAKLPRHLRDRIGAALAIQAAPDPGDPSCRSRP